MQLTVVEGVVMRRKLVSFVIAVIAIVSFVGIPASYSSGGFYRYVWNPEASRVNIKFDYPKEAHRGDIITYVLDGGWWSDRLVNEFNIWINYARDDGTWLTLYSTNLFTNVNVKADDPLDFTFQVEVPIHTAYIEYNLELCVAIRTNNSPLLDELDIFTTQIVDKTRTELTIENSELSYNYSSLDSSFDYYKQYHNYANSEYDSLNSTHTQYTQDHSHTNVEYSDLQARLTQATDLTNLLTILVIVVIFALIGSIAFFSARRHKTKSARV